MHGLCQLPPYVLFRNGIQHCIKSLTIDLCTLWVFVCRETLRLMTCFSIVIRRRRWGGGGGTELISRKG